LKSGHGLNIGDGKPVFWRLKNDEKGYWQRREKGDWKDMPNLYGPF
jgi:hypothetical protein